MTSKYYTHHQISVYLKNGKILVHQIKQGILWQIDGGIELRKQNITFGETVKIASIPELNFDRTCIRKHIEL